MKHGRLGFTVNPATHKAGNRRADGGLLGGFLDPLIGGGDPSTSSTDQVAANAAQDAGGASVPDSKPSISSSGSSSQHKAKPGFPSSASGSLSEAGASGSKEGYSQKALDAAVSGGLTKSYSPTAEHSLGLDIEANDVGYVAAIEIGSNKTQFLMLVSIRAHTIARQLPLRESDQFVPLIFLRRSIRGQPTPGCRAPSAKIAENPIKSSAKAFRRVSRAPPQSSRSRMVRIKRCYSCMRAKANMMAHRSVLLSVQVPALLLERLPPMMSTLRA